MNNENPSVSDIQKTKTSDVEGRRGRRRKRLSALVAIALALVILPKALLFVCSLFVSIDVADLEYGDDLVVTDRNGRALRHFPDDFGERHLSCDLVEVPSALIQAFLAAEDERFYEHPGYDTRAIIRASLSNIGEGQVVSGASTITQQLTRLVWPHPRTFRAKFIEILKAMKLERILEKEDILAHYLNRVPMGNNIVGVKLASQVYFDKVPADLSIAECALLASLPKAPGTMNPYHDDKSRLLVRRNWVLDRMKQLDFLSDEQCRREKKRAIEVETKEFAFEAPHLIERFFSKASRSTDCGKKCEEADIPGTQKRSIALTLDLGRQDTVEKILFSHRRKLSDKQALQASALVVENETGNVIAYVGSAEYGQRSEGFNDGVRALRSAGSTLKPFLYGYALDLGFTASEILRDLERSYRSVNGEYMPRNFNRAQYGPVSMRAALAGSLNLSSISLLNQVGCDPFYFLLDDLSLINHPECGPDHYGLGLAIGNPEVSLEQLVQAYCMLANGGQLRPLRYLVTDTAQETKRVLSPEAAFIISDILSDSSAGSLTFGSAMVSSLPLAWKTGTSTNYRDCWIVGYTVEHTIGIWAGNFDGSGTDELSGASAVGPILLDICRELYKGRSIAGFVPPEGCVKSRVCSYSGSLPGEFCPNHREEWFIRGTEPVDVCEYHKKDDVHHFLPMPYAGWVASQKELGRPSAYALQGFEGVLRKKEEHERKAARLLKPEETLIIGSDSKVSLSKGRVPDGGSIEIVYPLQNDRFVSNGASGDVVLLKAQVDWPAPEVVWYVDGFEHARVRPPYTASWELTRGIHTIAAATPDRKADEIVVRVE